MAIDHFEKHQYHVGRTDWNFNILFNDQPQVTQLAEEYRPLLRHHGLHKPVPGQWLHATVLRVGFLEDFTDDAMLAVAGRLEPRLAALEMPELTLGDTCWLWNGGPCLDITPDAPLQQLFSTLTQTIGEVVDQSHLPQNLTFRPHVTLAYPKTYEDEQSLDEQLKAAPIPGVPIRAEGLSLIKQHIEDDYYAWDTVKTIPIGQAA